MNQFDQNFLSTILALPTKSQQLELLKKHLIHNHDSRRMFEQSQNLVFGEGCLDAKILFIGEAPGKNEDLTGRPFVGASGKILDLNLKQIGLSREECYITNIVKYRPLNNRDPLENEKLLFLPYLLMQIFIIQPKVLATLGRHSLSVFYKNLKINQFHGTIKAIELKKINFKSNLINTKFDLLPLYHPAATMYNHNLKIVLEKDFQLLKQYL
jgi:uracil-DNA glycosylase family 4